MVSTRINLPALGFFQSPIHILGAAEHLGSDLAGGGIQMRAIKRRVLLDLGPGFVGPSLDSLVQGGEFSLFVEFGLDHAGVDQVAAVAFGLVEL